MTLQGLCFKYKMFKCMVDITIAGNIGQVFNLAINFDKLGIDCQFKTHQFCMRAYDAKHSYCQI